MTPILSIIGSGMVSPAERLGSGVTTEPVALAGRFGDPVPDPAGFVVAGFDVRKELGRKGTSFYDRRTALSVVACGRALSDAALVVDDRSRDRVGMVEATTAGSVKSATDYAYDSFAQDVPYMVNPGLFPNTVMNGAAGQAAIRYGLRGVNATVCGGPVAFLTALRYAAVITARGRADALVVGATEEFTPHAAWMSRASGAATRAGEGSAMFVVVPPAKLPPDTSVRAQLTGIALGFSATDPAAALAGAIGTALAQASVDPGDVTVIATGGSRSGAGEDLVGASWAAFAGSPVPLPPRIEIEQAVGDCQSASSALELAAVLADAGTDAAPRVCLLTAYNAEGAVAAGVIQVAPR